MVTPPEYIPCRGDIVWLTFDPQSGHEQAGRRPAVVLSPDSYNTTVGLALCCPVTNRSKGYPFEVSLPSTQSIQGVILADQIKSLDWRTRDAEYIETAPDEVMKELFNKIGLLLTF